MSQYDPIIKQEGVTPSEKYLLKMCDKSFLSLWSYPGVYNDDGKKGGGDGKEISDILVVFGNQLLVFSDKSISITNSGTIDIDWARWYKRAVLESAIQLWRGERWLRRHPNRIFVDRRCTQPLPVPLPDVSKMKIHLIAIAHGAGQRCKELLGGSGSLIIMPSLKGKAHYEGPIENEDIDKSTYDCWGRSHKLECGYKKTVLPFAIGDVDPDKSFIHIFDDVGLDVVIGELDTISDFVEYLTHREEYLRSGHLLSAAGEDDLLAHYLQVDEGNRKRGFYIPEVADLKILIPEGEWESLQADSLWIGKKEHDKISYAWDRVIERFSEHVLGGTTQSPAGNDFSTHERTMRVLARENRFHRRILSTALGEFITARHANEVNTRLVMPIQSGDPCYIFLAIRPRSDDSHEDYRKHRWVVAQAYSIQAKIKYPDAHEVLVIATETSDWKKWSSEDALYRGIEPLHHDEIELVEGLAANGFDALSNTRLALHAQAYEYTVASRLPHSPAFKGFDLKVGRNERCPCNSGKKYKKCCM